jgi:hypothetical protein
MPSQEDRLMVSDPVSLQYILNSPHFTFGPNLENTVHLLNGKKSIMGVNGVFLSCPVFGFI